MFEQLIGVGQWAGREHGGDQGVALREGVYVAVPGPNLETRAEYRMLRTIGAAGPRFLTHPIPVRSRGIFCATAPTHRSGLVPVARQVVRDLRIPPRDVRRLARLVFHLFTLTELELRQWDRRTLDEFVRQYTVHPGAYFLISFLASIFFVLPPWASRNSPAPRRSRLPRSRA